MNQRIAYKILMRDIGWPFNRRTLRPDVPIDQVEHAERVFGMERFIGPDGPEEAPPSRGRWFRKLQKIKGATWKRGPAWRYHRQVETV